MQTADAHRQRAAARAAATGPRGVTLYKRTGRWVANLWQPTTEDRGPGKRRGFQVHLGAFATQDLAMLAYDRALFKARGPTARLNAPRDWGADAWWQAHANLPWPHFLTALREWGQSTFSGAPPAAPPPPPHGALAPPPPPPADVAGPWSAPFSPLPVSATPFLDDETAEALFFADGGGGFFPDDDGGDYDGYDGALLLPGRGSADEVAAALDAFGV